MSDAWTLALLVVQVACLVPMALVVPVEWGSPRVRGWLLVGAGMVAAIALWNVAYLVGRLR